MDPPGSAIPSAVVASASRERSHPPGPADDPQPRDEAPNAEKAATPPREAPAVFREGAAEPIERERLLETRVKDLSLSIAGTRVERMVEQLYRELKAAGLAYRPRCYLSDEWGCPDGKPIIGIPFYLADEKLALMEGEINDAAEEERESLMYLRHEAGHAFNYAYGLYRREDFHELFGPYTRPYVEDWRVQPFSRSFVRHIAGWYAQKHPDEDFAETFAVLITPGLDWRALYAGWPAVKKLEWAQARLEELGAATPPVAVEAPDQGDVPVEAVEETVAELLDREGPPVEVSRQLAEHLDGDLRALFDAPGAFPARAADLVEPLRRQIVPSIAYWTGLPQPTVKALVMHLIARCRALELTVRTGGEADAAARFSVFVTTLAMNRVYSGKFCEL